MNETILILDDSLTVRMDLADAFQSAGFRPLPCATAAEMRSILARERPALVILDVVLPDADGLELLAELRASPATASTPILLLSSEAEVRDRVRGLQTGADDYVGKPYDAVYVIARARELLAARTEPTRVGVASILVVDDSPTFRDTLRRALEVAGFLVFEASSGEEGLRVAAARRPNAILVDGIMPGIDGATVIRRIRLDVALRSTPCVLLTAAESVGAELQALDAGADAFVRKDADFDVILARLAVVLRGGAGQEAGMPSLSGPKRILAVDDSPTYLDALATTLRDEGYDVILAHSGEEAIELLAVQSVDCILMDVVMPGLGGQETCRRLKLSSGARDIPLILLTALEGRVSMIEGLGAGADDFVSKSGDADILKARVRAQLRRKQVEDEHRRIRDQLRRNELEAAEGDTARRVAEARAALADALERKNQELEAFSYSVSHDLRAPLRSIHGFCALLERDCAGSLTVEGRHYLDRVRESATRMSELIDALLALSSVSRADLIRDPVDLTELARTVGEEIRRREPGLERIVEIEIADGLSAQADRKLVQVLFENLLGNAWKFTSKVKKPRIEVGLTQRDGTSAFFVRDNGAGFDSANSKKLFTPFQRLHAHSEFEGTGVGLATVRRVVDRHGGRIWADGEVGKGASFYFTLNPEQNALQAESTESAESAEAA